MIVDRLKLWINKLLPHRRKQRLLSKYFSEIVSADDRGWPGHQTTVARRLAIKSLHIIQPSDLFIVDFFVAVPLACILVAAWNRFLFRRRPATGPILNYVQFGFLQSAPSPPPRRTKVISTRWYQFPTIALHIYDFYKEFWRTNHEIHNIQWIEIKLFVVLIVMKIIWLSIS